MHVEINDKLMHEGLTILPTKGIIRTLNICVWRQAVEYFLDGALIIISIALIVSVIMQSKGAGLGGLTGADTGGIFTARRGIEKVLFWVTIGLGILFFIVIIATVKVKG
jgi:preprotein translocase subunit SecG